MLTEPDFPLIPEDPPVNDTSVVREEPKRKRGNPELKGRPKMAPVKCLVPQCQGFFGATGEPGGRGLCKDCHNKASALIRRKVTTWEELEGLHLAQPKYGSIVEKALMEARRAREQIAKEQKKEE